MKRKGFTLVELMIVITVIAILATIAVVSFTRVQKQARDTKRRGDVRALATALQAYFSEKNTYPATTAELTPLYIPSIPANPVGDGFGGTYSYAVISAENKFRLCAAQEAMTEGAKTFWNVTTQNTGGYLATSCVAAE